MQHKTSKKRKYKDIIEKKSDFNFYDVDYSIPYINQILNINYSIENLAKKKYFTVVNLIVNFGDLEDFRKYLIKEFIKDRNERIGEIWPLISNRKKRRVYIDRIIETLKMYSLIGLFIDSIKTSHFKQIIKDSNDRNRDNNIGQNESSGRGKGRKRKIKIDEYFNSILVIIYDNIIEFLRNLNLKKREGIEEFIKFIYTGQISNGIIKRYFKKYLSQKLGRSKNGKLLLKYLNEINEYINYAYLTKSKHLIEDRLRYFSKYSTNINKESDYEYTIEFISKFVKRIEEFVLSGEILTGQVMKFLVEWLSKEVFQDTDIVGIDEKDKWELMKILTKVRNYINIYKIRGYEQLINELIKEEIKRRFKITINLEKWEDIYRIIEREYTKHPEKFCEFNSLGDIFNYINELRNVLIQAIDETNLYSNLIKYLGGEESLMMFNAINNKLSIHIRVYQHNPKGDEREITFQDLISDDKAIKDYEDVERNKDLESFINVLNGEIERNKEYLTPNDIKILKLLMKSLKDDTSPATILETIHNHISKNQLLKDLIISAIRKTNFIDL